MRRIDPLVLILLMHVICFSYALVPTSALSRFIDIRHSGRDGSSCTDIRLPSLQIHRQPTLMPASNNGDSNIYGESIEPILDPNHDILQSMLKSSHEPSITPSSTTIQHRRQVLHTFVTSSCIAQTLLLPQSSRASDTQTTTKEQSKPIPRGTVFETEDPNSYSAVAYVPPSKRSKTQQLEQLPLLVVLHGAGINQHSALFEFTNAGSSSSPPGDHINLPPYLLSTDQAPSSLADNFVVVAPYVGKDKRSLYDEPRGKLISFVKWFRSWIEEQSFVGGTDNSSSRIKINPQKTSLFGFSEGATLAVELATTRQFNGVVLASYGFMGTLPKMAVERLQGIPLWVFHSKGDDIYNIECSNRLVESLISYEGGLGEFVALTIID
jgi:predicted esterase